MHNIYLYILIMAGTSYAIRSLPMLLLKKPIKSRFIRSFLYYVPYATLAVMTFPSILKVTENPLPGAFAFILGIFLAWKGVKLLGVAAGCCFAVLLLEYIA